MTDIQNTPPTTSPSSQANRPKLGFGSALQPIQRNPRLTNTGSPVSPVTSQPAPAAPRLSSTFKSTYAPAPAGQKPLEKYKSPKNNPKILGTILNGLGVAADFITKPIGTGAATVGFGIRTTAVNSIEAAKIIGEIPVGLITLAKNAAVDVGSLAKYKGAGVTGNPRYGAFSKAADPVLLNSLKDAAGNPVIGPDGKPVLMDRWDSAAEDFPFASSFISMPSTVLAPSYLGSIVRDFRDGKPIVAKALPIALLFAGASGVISKGLAKGVASKTATAEAGTEYVAAKAAEKAAGVTATEAKATYEAAAKRVAEANAVAENLTAQASAEAAVKAAMGIPLEEAMAAAEAAVAARAGLAWADLRAAMGEAVKADEYRVIYEAAEKARLGYSAKMSEAVGMAQVQNWQQAYNVIQTVRKYSNKVAMFPLVPYVQGLRLIGSTYRSGWYLPDGTFRGKTVPNAFRAWGDNGIAGIKQELATLIEKIDAGDFNPSVTKTVNGYELLGEPKDLRFGKGQPGSSSDPIKLAEAEAIRLRDKANSLSGFRYGREANRIINGNIRRTETAASRKNTQWNELISRIDDSGVALSKAEQGAIGIVHDGYYAHLIAIQEATGLPMPEIIRMTRYNARTGTGVDEEMFDLANDYYTGNITKEKYGDEYLTQINRLDKGLALVREYIGLGTQDALSGVGRQFPMDVRNLDIVAFHDLLIKDLEAVVKGRSLNGTVSTPDDIIRAEFALMAIERKIEKSREDDIRIFLDENPELTIDDITPDIPLGVFQRDIDDPDRRAFIQAIWQMSPYSVKLNQDNMPSPMRPLIVQAQRSITYIERMVNESGEDGPIGPRTPPGAPLNPEALQKIEEGLDEVIRHYKLNPRKATEDTIEFFNSLGERERYHARLLYKMMKSADHMHAIFIKNEYQLRNQEIIDAWLNDESVESLLFRNPELTEEGLSQIVSKSPVVMATWEMQKAQESFAKGVATPKQLQVSQEKLAEITAAEFERVTLLKQDQQMLYEALEEYENYLEIRIGTMLETEGVDVDILRQLATVDGVNELAGNVPLELSAVPEPGVPTSPAAKDTTLRKLKVVLGKKEVWPIFSGYITRFYGDVGADKFLYHNDGKEFGVVQILSETETAWTVKMDNPAIESYMDYLKDRLSRPGPTGKSMAKELESITKQLEQQDKPGPLASPVVPGPAITAVEPTPKPLKAPKEPKPVVAKPDPRYAKLDKEIGILEKAYNDARAAAPPPAPKTPKGKIAPAKVIPALAATSDSTLYDILKNANLPKGWSTSENQDGVLDPEFPGVDWMSETTDNIMSGFMRFSMENFNSTADVRKTIEGIREYLKKEFLKPRKTALSELDDYEDIRTIYDEKLPKKNPQYSMLVRGTAEQINGAWADFEKWYDSVAPSSTIAATPALAPPAPAAPVYDAEAAKRVLIANAKAALDAKVQELNDLLAADEIPATAKLAPADSPAVKAVKDASKSLVVRSVKNFAQADVPGVLSINSMFQSPAAGKKAIAALKLLAESFPNPAQPEQPYPVVSIYGDSEVLRESLRQLIHFTISALEIKGTEKRIAYILDRVQGINPELKKQLLSGAYRSPESIASIPLYDSHHPLTKFASSVSQKIDLALDALDNLRLASERYADVNYVDYSTVPGIERVSMSSYDKLHPAEYVPSYRISADELNFPGITKPEIYVSAALPVEMAIDAISGFIKALEDNAPLRPKYIENTEGFEYEDLGYYEPRLKGFHAVMSPSPLFLSKKNKALKAEVIAVFERIKSSLEALAPQNDIIEKLRISQFGTITAPDNVARLSQIKDALAARPIVDPTLTAAQLRKIVPNKEELLAQRAIRNLDYVTELAMEIAAEELAAVRAAKTTKQLITAQDALLKKMQRVVNADENLKKVVRENLEDPRSVILDKKRARLAEKIEKAEAAIDKRQIYRVSLSTARVALEASLGINFETTPTTPEQFIQMVRNFTSGEPLPASPEMGVDDELMQNPVIIELGLQAEAAKVKMRNLGYSAIARPGSYADILSKNDFAQIAYDAAVKMGNTNNDIFVEVFTQETNGIVKEYVQFGPRYLPVGSIEKVGSTERVRVDHEGFVGWIEARSAKHRTADRESILDFNIIGQLDVQQTRILNQNEQWRAWVLGVGKTATEYLGEELIFSLWKKAEDYAGNLSEVELYKLYPEGVPVEITPGIDQYNPSLKNPQTAYNYAVQSRFGELITREMQKSLKAPVLIYSSINAMIYPRDINGETYFIDAAAKDIYAQSKEKITNLTAGVDLLRKATGLFKASTLFLSLTWQIGDMTTNAIWPLLADAITIPEMIESLKTVYGAIGKHAKDPVGTPEEIREKQARTARLEKFLRDSGVQSIGFDLQEQKLLKGTEKPVKEEGEEKENIGLQVVKKIFRGVDAAVDWSFALNSATNTVQRYAVFYNYTNKWLAEQGISFDDFLRDETYAASPEYMAKAEQFANDTNDLLGDVINLNKTDKRIFMLLFPFWAWIKTSHRYFLRLAKDHPARLQFTLYIGMFAMDQDNRKDMQIWDGTVNIGGRNFNTTWINPFYDVVNGPAVNLIGAMLGSEEYDATKWIQSVNPLIRIPFAAATGLDLKTFKPVTRPSGSGYYNPETGIERFKPLLNLKDPSELLGYSIQQIPLLSRITEALPFKNIPGTRIALGPVSKYGTGEARINPRTGQRNTKQGGVLGALSRIVSTPLSGTTLQQELDISRSSQARLKTIRELQREYERSRVP